LWRGSSFAGTAPLSSHCCTFCVGVHGHCSSSAAAAAAGAAATHLLQAEQFDLLLCLSPPAGFRLHNRHRLGTTEAECWQSAVDVVRRLAVASNTSGTAILLQHHMCRVLCYTSNAKKRILNTHIGETTVTISMHAVM
jgi:hypothetical protein